MQTTLTKLPTITRCTTCNVEIFYIPRRGYRDKLGQLCGTTWKAPHLPNR